MPAAWMRPAMPLTARLMAIRNKASDDAARTDIAALPGQLDADRRVDRRGPAGRRAAERRRPAGRQHDPAAAQTIADLRPLIEAHPRIAELTRYFPSPQPGEIPLGTLPAQWLPAA